MKSPLNLVVAICWICTIHDVNSSQRIAILDFELYDITSMPYTAQEKQRTASIRPMLEQALAQSGTYQIVDIPAERQAKVNAGFGYLFRFHDLAATLGEQHHADWVLVGRHSKPSFLFSYLMGNLIEVRSHARRANFAIELKGSHPSVLQHGIKALARDIAESIAETKGKH
ncbi:MAG: DUF2380 domain-containing protein [Gammaproteobacteria bacterium]